jgi:hypothetical protein
MKRRRLLISTSLLLTIALLVLISTVFRKIDVISPPVPQEGIAGNPKVTFDDATGTASMEISVMIYNVAGLPWPIGCGKYSRETDESARLVSSQISSCCRRLL